MGYPVSYSGAIEVQPPLSDAHAKLVEVCVDLEGSEDGGRLSKLSSRAKSRICPTTAARRTSPRTAPRLKHARESNVTDSDFGSSIW
jgi:hypothetical protein